MDMDVTISPSAQAHYFNPVNYVPKTPHHTMKESSDYTDENTDCFQDDSSQGSASSVMVDFEQKPPEEHQHGLSNIFDHLNDITKSMAGAQFPKPCSSDHSSGEFPVASKLGAVTSQSTDLASQQPLQNPYNNLPLESNHLANQFKEEEGTPSNIQNVSSISDLPSTSSAGAPGYEALLEKVSDVF